MVNKQLKQAKKEVKEHLEDLYRRAKFKNLFYAELVGKKYDHPLIHLKNCKLITNDNVGTFKVSDFIVSLNFKAMINGTFRKLEPKLEWFEIEPKTEAHLESILNKTIKRLDKQIPEYAICVGKMPVRK